MIDNFDNGTPLRFKQSKLKPLRTMLYCFLPIISMLIFSFFTVNASDAETGETLLQLYPGTIAAIIAVVSVTVSGISYIIAYLVWRSDGFSVSNEGISYAFTFIIKRFVKLPYDKINTVKIKRNIIDIILGLSAVKIGSGSGLTSGAAEITLVFNKKYAEYFKDYIQKRAAAVKDGKSLDAEFVPPDENNLSIPSAQESNGIRVTSSDKLRMIFTHDAYWLAAVIFIVAFPISYGVSYIYFGEESSNIIFIALAVTVVVFLLITAIVIAAVFLRYYDYKIYEENNCINISYGLLSKQSFSVRREKIRGFTVSQGIFGQLFKTGKLRLNVVGLSGVNANNNQSITYLYPAARIDRLREITELFLPEFKYGGDVQKAGNNAYLHNFTIPAFWVVVILLPFFIFPSVLVSPLFLLALPFILAIMLVNAALLKRNVSLGVSKGLLYAQSGGLYKKTIIQRTSSVQQIRSYAGFIRRKQGINTYLISYRGDNIIAANRILVRNLPKINLDNFE